MKSSSNKAKATTREPEKFSPLTMSPFKITALPTVKGVAGLSSSEIKNDLKELLPPSEDNDTDSDSSLLSDDILDSVYPVQPRSAPRSASDGLRYQDYSSSGNNVNVDEALFLLKDISKSHKELYNKEITREDFELRCQALDTNLEFEKGKFLSIKQEQENYLKLVQGLYARMVRLHSTYSRQNALLHSVYSSLHQQREAEQALTAESAKLKATASSSARGGRVAGKVSADAASTPLLKVHLQKSNIDVVLQVGQAIPTPMGEAIVTKILPAEHKLVLQLPFGILYAHLPRAVSWCSTSTVMVDCTNTLVQRHSLQGIQQHYHDTLQERLTLPPVEVARIHSLVAQSQSLAQRVSEEEVANTDNDEASVSSEMEDGTQSVSEEVLPTAGSAESAETTEAETSNSKSTGNNNRRGNGAGDVDHSRVFPMAFDSASVLGRSVVKKKLETEVGDKFSQYLLQTLPLAFAPAASLPYVAAELGQTVSGTSSGVPHAQRVHGIEYDLSALQSLAQNYPFVGAHGHTHSPSNESAPPAGSASVRTTVAHGGQLGASGSLAWQGEIDQLKGTLRDLGEQINQLEAEQNRKIAEIESLRSRSAQLTAAAATTRLNMFTRRLAHRTNLGNRGIVLPPVAPVISHQNKSRSSNQSRSSNHNLNGNNSANGSNGQLASQDAVAALLLAAGEGRSSRSKKTSSTNLRADETEKDSFGPIAGGIAPGYSSMLRASTDSPVSTHSLHGDDHVDLRAQAISNSRNRSRGAAGTFNKDEGVEALAMLAGGASNKRRGNGRRVADEIVASVSNTQEDEVDAERDENDVSDGEVAGAAATTSAAAARKKPKRRRY